jgi:hypothetical protein
MTKINNTGGGPRPTTDASAAEPVKDTSKASETSQSSAPETSASQSPVTGDKYAAGDLHARGEKVKSNLDAELAAKAAKHQPTFAPPYVPVGPVVMGDNIGVPGQTPETKQMNLKPDQFKIDQGNLVITNEKLIEYFKQLKATGQEILLGITPKKPE